MNFAQSGLTYNFILLSFIVSGYYALGNSGRALVDISIVISQIGDLSVTINNIVHEFIYLIRRDS